VAGGSGNLRPIRPGERLALKHGATSERQIRPLARNHRRRLLRQIGTSARDLDPLGRGYLDQYARLMAKVELIDAYVDERGLLNAKGEPVPAMRLYVSLMNSARLALARLEGHLRILDRDPLVELTAYLSTKRDDADDDDAAS
jgi:hypothetical protein